MAGRQDWRTVTAILDYRTLAAAKEQHNSEVEKMTPAMVELWMEMAKICNEEDYG